MGLAAYRRRALVTGFLGRALPENCHESMDAGTAPGAGAAGLLDVRDGPRTPGGQGLHAVVGHGPAETDDQDARTGVGVEGEALDEGSPAAPASGSRTRPTACHLDALELQDIERSGCSASSRLLQLDDDNRGPGIHSGGSRGCAATPAALTLRARGLDNPR